MFPILQRLRISLILQRVRIEDVPPFCRDWGLRMFPTPAEAGDVPHPVVGVPPPAEPGDVPHPAQDLPHPVEDVPPPAEAASSRSCCPRDALARGN